METESASLDNGLKMKLKDVVEIIKGRVVCGSDKLDREVEFAFASDLMSDVLTVQLDNMLLLTGLANIQAIRTAEMSDISCVVFVRNKKVSPDMIKLGEESGIVLVECSCSMFKTSGVLYKNGLKPVF
ncbi:MAG: DRTGG domain-containing protein [Tenuifilaceae bacterium]